MDLDAINQLADRGFAVAVAAFVLLRLDHQMGALTKEIRGLRQAMLDLLASLLRPNPP